MRSSLPEGHGIDQIVRSEVQNQIASNVTVRNVITSMRLISTISWPEWFESVSLVDTILREESAFAEMDFPTRDLYRRAIETLARSSEHAEIEVAKQAVAAAERACNAVAKTKQPLTRACDPGYYLISRGRPAFEKQLGCRVPLKTRLFRANATRGAHGYVWLVAFVTAIVLGCGLLETARQGLSGWAIVLLGILGAIPASDVAVTLINRLITQKVGATPLPGLSLRDEIPAELATIVVVPTLLTSEAAIEEQVERLEVHFLSNAENNLYFALLSDWKDSDEERSAADDKLLIAASDAIARLNQKYPQASAGVRFFLLHRRRKWCEGERKWMGWERKRGKLHELNRLLRGATDTTFLNVDGTPAPLPTKIRYVVTLDSDTRMPIGTAKRLIGKIAHPLTRPRFDPDLGVVVEGHGILQPRDAVAAHWT